MMIPVAAREKLPLFCRHLCGVQAVDSLVERRRRLRPSGRAVSHSRSAYK